MRRRKSSVTNMSAYSYTMGALYEIYLENTTPPHNKFYRMNNTEDGFFTVTYGKIGSKGVFITYPENKWFDILSDKLNGKYVIKSTKDISANPARTVTPISTPATNPKTGEPISTEVRAKIRLVANACMVNKTKYKEVNGILHEYENTGILKRFQMIRLNEIYLAIQSKK